MKQLDFDRAFPQTPDCIHTAIELGVRKGKKKMKLRNKLIAAAGAAAVFAVAIAAALAMGIERPETPDVLSQPPLNVALAGPEAPDSPKLSEAETFIVYTTENGRYYHLNEHCSGMENASAMTEAEAMQLSKTPCPICIPLSCSGHDREEIEFVHYSQGGVYFHKAEECSGGTFALKGSESIVVGTCGAVWEGEDLHAVGEWVTDRVHGRQFKAKSISCIPPKSTAMVWVDVDTEVSPIVGTQEQSAALVEHLMGTFEKDPGAIWQTNIFGKPLYDLVREGMQGKIGTLPEAVRERLQMTLERIVNEGCNGLICIML